MTNTKAPITLKCKVCGEILILNEDSIETRAAQTDPHQHQQIRKHLGTHPMHLIRLARETGWLIDLLAFEPTTEDSKNRWKAHVNDLFEFFLAKV